VKNSDRRWGARVAVIAAALALVPAARAGSILGLTGVDVSAHSLYGYAGAIATLKGGADESGPLVRVWWDRLTYDFQGAPGKVDASSWGDSASLGWQHAYASGMVSGYAGIDSRNTKLTPSVASKSAGEHTGARFELDVDHRINGDWRFNQIGSYVTANADYWTRTQLLHALKDGLVVGPEMIWMGNPDYDAHRFGAAVMGIPIYKSLKAAIDAGYDKNSSEPAAAYGSLSLAASF
jgi:cellulose biosynthesis protein BcsS